MSKQIYQIAVTASSAASGDWLAMDRASDNVSQRLTYANFFSAVPSITVNGAANVTGALNVTGAIASSGTISSTGAVTGASCTFSGQAVAGQLRVTAPVVPSATGDVGTAGEIVWDSSNIYVCVATNSWKRVAIATW